LEKDENDGLDKPDSPCGSGEGGHDCQSIQTSSSDPFASRPILETQDKEQRPKRYQEESSADRSLKDELVANEPAVKLCIIRSRRSDADIAFIIELVISYEFQ